MCLSCSAANKKTVNFNSFFRAVLQVVKVTSHLNVSLQLLPVIHRCCSILQIKRRLMVTLLALVVKWLCCFAKTVIKYLV